MLEAMDEKGDFPKPPFSSGIFQPAMFDYQRVCFTIVYKAYFPWGNNGNMIYKLLFFVDEETTINRGYVVFMNFFL